MATSNWYNFRNFFDNVTKSSHRRMHVMARDHHDKLKNAAISEPQIMQLYNEFMPPYFAFIDAYSEYASIKASYRTATMRVTNKFIDLTYKIKEWDIKIQSNYMDDTPEYAGILPNRRLPFQSGSYESRIAELFTLEKNLAKYPVLNVILNDVQNFAADLNNLRTEQQGFESEETEMSKRVEDARLALSKKMHGIYGYLLYLYQDNTSMLEKFYERKYFETNTPNTAATPLTIYQIPANNRLSLYAGEITENSKFIIQNTSESVLEFYAADMADANAPMDAIKLQANEKGEFLISEIGNGLPERELKVLIISNVSAQSGSFKIAKIEIPTEE